MTVSRAIYANPVAAAAQWLATEKSPPHPIIPYLRKQFGLSSADAIAAIRESHLIKARSS
ncbi:hypothetical protein CO731_04973 [Aminobacter sp. MSH1]|uniref:hypothetical protein n=1 Tax=Aminobacter sp. MSH1 TaxID=374606 RepID=UPI000D364326|nr:hypothetical protein [Aminobacter sp. MSH1]AWC25476.1 hypothetical protein CO731_04973 [Aminobacter sp. MSH1]